MSARRRLFGLAVLVAGTVVLAGGGASAQTGPEEFNYEPTEGPPGVQVTISGTCTYGEVAFVYFFRVQDEDTNEPFDHFEEYPVSGGAFSGVFPVPEEAPPDEYAFEHVCIVDGDQVVEGSGNNPFLVTGEKQPTTTSTSTTSSTTSTSTSPSSSTTPSSPSTSRDAPPGSSRGTGAQADTLPATGGGDLLRLGLLVTGAGVAAAALGRRRLHRLRH